LVDDWFAAAGKAGMISRISRTAGPPALKMEHLAPQFFMDGRTQCASFE